MDAPSREECTARRTRSNTPTAAMVLLNDPTFVGAAEALAQHIIEEGGENDHERLEFAYRTVLSRRPDETERSVLGKLFASNTNQAEAWKAIARALLNLSETTTRN